MIQENENNSSEVQQDKKGTNGRSRRRHNKHHKNDNTKSENASDQLDSPSNDSPTAVSNNPQIVTPNELEMHRDAEYRRLNALLREKEDKLKRLENDRAIDTLVAKISRTSISKQSTGSGRGNAKSRESNQGSRATAKESGVEGEMKVPSDNNLNDVNTNNSKHAGKKEKEKVSSRSGGGKGILRITPQHPAVPLTNTPSKQITEVAAKKERSNDIDIESQRLNDAKLLEDARRSMRDAEKIAISKLRQFEGDESACINEIENVRKDKARLQDFCLLGPAIGASTLYHKLIAIEQYITEKVLSDSMSHVVNAIHSNLIHRLWHVKSLEVKLLVDVLKGAKAKGRDTGSSISQVKTTLLSLLVQISTILETYLNHIKSFITDVTDKVSDIALIREVAQSILLYQAELSKIKVEYCSSGDDPNSVTENMWSETISYINQAVVIAPSSGKVHHMLSSIAMASGDMFETAYQLCRGMCAASHPITQSREHLLEVFETERRKSEALVDVSALARMSLIEHRDRFLCHLQAAAGIAYSRSAADKFTFHMDKTSRHLGSMLQSLSREVLSNSGRGQKGDFKDFNQSKFHSSGSYSTQEESAVAIVDDILCHSLVLCLGIVHVISRKHTLKAICDGANWSNCFGTMNPDTLSQDDKTAMENRYIANLLHKVQIIPGLMDISKLIIGFVSTMLGSDGVCSMTNSGDPASLLRLNVTCRSLSIFFEWLECNPEYHIFAVLDKISWTHMESLIPGFLSGLPRISKSSDSTSLDNMTVEKDRDLDGFEPLNVKYSDRRQLSSDISDSNVVFIERVRCSVRKLCSTNVCIGNASHGVYFDSRLNAVQASALSSSCQPKTVISYPTAAPTMAMGSSVNRILTREQFMKGVDVEAEETEDSGTSESDEEDGSLSEHSKERTSDLGDTTSNDIVEGNVIDVGSISKAVDSSQDTPVSSATVRRGMLKIDRDVVSDSATNKSQSQSSQNNKDKKHGNKKGSDNGNKARSKAESSGLNFRPLQMKSLPLIVVDAPNVAMRHGLNLKFSCRGIKLALDFFKAAGHQVLSFLPDYYLNFERVGELRRQANLNIGEIRAAQLPDDIALLQQLVASGVIIGTPSQDYDDSYCISYARQRDGYVVSNDMYRDHIKLIKNSQVREDTKKWIKSHVISYVFIGDEFLPNPDAAINLGSRDI